MKYKPKMGQTVYVTEGANKDRAGTVRGFNSLGEPILEANDNQPWIYRGSHRRVLDFPPCYLSEDRRTFADYAANKLREDGLMPSLADNLARHLERHWPEYETAWRATRPL